MLTLHKPVLPVKLMLLFTVIIISGCTARQTVPEGNISSAKTGWINDETYRITGKGVSSSEITDPDKRKEDSLRNAISNAQKATLDIFTTYYTDYTEGGGIQGYGNRKYEFISYVRQIIVTGRAVKINYDSNQNCEIIYEIKQERLRKKVTEFF